MGTIVAPSIELVPSVTYRHWTHHPRFAPGIFSQVITAQVKRSHSSLFPKHHHRIGVLAFTGHTNSDIAIQFPWICYRIQRRQRLLLKARPTLTMPAQKTCCCDAHSKWNIDADVALLRALKCRFGGVPKQALPSKRSLRSIRRFMQKETGGRWFNREIESRIRIWRELEDHERSSQARQSTSTRKTFPSYRDPSPPSHARAKQPQYPSYTNRTAAFEGRSRTPPKSQGSRGLYQQEAMRHTQQKHECACEGHGGDGVNAFKGASDFGVGTVNVRNVSYCCGQRT